MYCDEMRIKLSVPKTEYIDLNKSENWYYYYDMAELEGKFLFFMTNGLSHLKSRSSGFPFLLFENKNQRKLFNEYIAINENILDGIEPGFHGKSAQKELQKKKLNPSIDPIFIDKIKQIHEQWAAHNKWYTF